MKPGDLVRPLPGYSESRNPPYGVIIEIKDLHGSICGNRALARFNVLFPEGVFPMYDFEMEIVNEAG